MFLNLFVTVIRRAQVRGHLRLSIGGLLTRQDDHLLDDIGLTRHQAEMLVADAPLDRPHMLRRAFTGIVGNGC